MGKESITDWRTILRGILSIVITFSFKKVNSALVVIGGATVVIAVNYFLIYVLLKSDLK